MRTSGFGGRCWGVGLVDSPEVHEQHEYRVSQSRQAATMHAVYGGHPEPAPMSAGLSDHIPPHLVRSLRAPSDNRTIGR